MEIGELFVIHQFLYYISKQMTLESYSQIKQNTHLQHLTWNVKH